MFSRISLLFALLSTLPVAAQEAKPVGVKLVRPGISGIAGTPPVGGTLVSYDYSLDTPRAGDALHGQSTFFEQTLDKHLSLLLTTTDMLVRSSQTAFGDICPGIKFVFPPETKHRPLLAVAYAVKVPTASEGFGSGHYDHKAIILADKLVGRTKWTGNFATTWAGQKDGTYVRQYMPSLAILTRWHGQWGSATQTYWTTAGKGYGGVVLGPFYQVNRNFNVFAGGLRNFGRYSTAYSVVLGVNFMHRPVR
jgi:hypothetical protein